MGWYMKSTKSKFFLPVEDRMDAHNAAIEALEGEDGLDLIEVLQHHGFEVVCSDKGDISGLSFPTSSSFGTEHDLLQAIAPWVEEGSFIEMTGEDDSVWRWYFDGLNCQHQPGRVVYDEPDVEVRYSIRYIDTLTNAFKTREEALAYCPNMAPGQRVIKMEWKP